MTHARRLRELDLTLKLSKSEEQQRLAVAQRNLLTLRLHLGGMLGRREVGPGLCVLFEGWDASGKGGAIKRLVAPLDPRHFTVATFGVPAPDDKRHHFLWRFIPALPGWGSMSVLDRSWYGRVLVERVQELVTPEEWTLAYEEIVQFEAILVRQGTILVKFWLHISPEEQLRRFNQRQQDELRHWKLTDEDWRNRGQWDAYEAAAEDMLAHTDHEAAPWQLVEAESKRYARVKVIETTIDLIERSMRERDIEPPPRLG